MRGMNGTCIGALALAAVSLSLSSCRRERAIADATPIRLLLPSPATPSDSVVALMTRVNSSAAALRIVVEPTPGSGFVVSKMQRGDGEIGLAQSDVVYLAYRRGTAQDPYPHLNLTGVAVGGLNRLSVFVRRDTNINNIVDLRGRRVAVAPPGTAGELLTRMVLDAHGLNFKDLDVRVHQIREMGRYFEAEQLDAMIMVGTFDPESVTAPVTKDQLRLLPVDAAIISRLRGEYPFMKPAEITWHDAQRGVESVLSVGADSLVIARKDLPEAIVYKLTSELLGALPGNNPFAIDPDTAPATPIPLHPGAARYYRELQLLR